MRKNLSKPVWGVGRGITEFNGINLLFPLLKPRYTGSDLYKILKKKTRFFNDKYMLLL